MTLINTNKSAVVWRKGFSVFFMIFWVSTDHIWNPCEMVYHMHYSGISYNISSPQKLTLKPWAQKWETSVWFFNSGLGEKSLWCSWSHQEDFFQTRNEAPYGCFSFLSNLHQEDFSQAKMAGAANLKVNFSKKKFACISILNFGA